MIPISEFKFERNPNPNMSACSFAVIGSSKSGKTTFINYLLKNYFQNDIKVLFSQSLHNPIYKEFDGLKNLCKCPGYAPDVIREMYKINKGAGNKYEFLAIIDDVAGVKNDPEIVRLLALYRNTRISGLVCGQDPMMISPTGRANTNYHILFYANTDQKCEDTVKMYLRSYFPRNLTMTEKIQLFKELTKNHCFLVVDNLNNTIQRCKLTPEQLSMA